MKYVLVTGTGSGIGLSTVQKLKKDGYFVFANGKSETDLILWKDTENVYPILFDVRDKEATLKAAKEIGDYLKSIDQELFAIINNAGISSWGPLLDISEEVFKDTLNTNLLGPLNVYQSFYPLLNKENSRIINMSSISGKIIFPFMGPYHVSKAALEALTDSQRREHLLNGDRGVKVIIIQPGSVDTRLWERAKNTRIFPEDSPMHNTAMNVGHGVIDQEVKGVFPPLRVAKTIAKALRVTKPKTRYIVSPQKWIFKVIMLLPDRWFDNMLLLITKKFRKKKA